MRVLGFLVYFFCFVFSGCAGLAEFSDRAANTVISPPPQTETNPAFRAFFDSLFIADLHADTFLWGRSEQTLIGAPGSTQIGHIDLRRLVDGNIALQVFSSVTQYSSPINRSGVRCHEQFGGNQIDTLLRAQGRYSAELTYLARALAQAKAASQFSVRLKEMHRESSGSRSVSVAQMTLIRDADQFASFLARWQANQSSRKPARQAGTTEPAVEIGAVLAIEGLHRDNAQPASVEELFGNGVRMMALTHHFDNELAGSNTGCAKGGLTERGAEVLTSLSRQSAIVDLAHVSEKSAVDILSRLPGQTQVVISHTGLASHCDDGGYGRHISAELIRRVARHDGVVGVMFHDRTLCCSSGKSCGNGTDGVITLANAFRVALAELSDPQHVQAMQGLRADYDPADHLALGSDYDGSIRAVVGVEYLSALVRELRSPSRAGVAAISDSGIRKIFGLNVCRIMAAGLPGGAPAKARASCQLVNSVSGSASL